jgi:hypothetical protein
VDPRQARTSAVQLQAPSVPFAVAFDSPLCQIRGLSTERGLKSLTIIASEKIVEHRL